LAQKLWLQFLISFDLNRGSQPIAIARWPGAMVAGSIAS